MSFQNQYSKLDRFLHRFAFATKGLQKALADMEDRFFLKKFQAIPIENPVFITSLPRAGTTLLLETLSTLDNFVSHTYRHLPFLLTPIFWNKIGSRFHKKNQTMERAHQDGMQVGYDSVEAFEEILWHSFWPAMYSASQIAIWQKAQVDEADEFTDFIKHHLQKILYLHSQKQKKADFYFRYLSKNNANIARIAKIKALFPDAIFVVPFRKPINHVGSMLKQHQNFLQIHQEDNFAKKYMADIGHFDFGANLKPINFNGWLTPLKLQQAKQTSFWMEYWCEAFEYLITHHQKDVFFVSYEDCCNQPKETLARLASIIKLKNPKALIQKAARFHPAREHEASWLNIDSAFKERSLKVFEKLMSLCV